MNERNKRLVMLALGCASGLAFSFGRSPVVHTVTQIETVEVEKEVIREVEVLKIQYKDRIRTKVVTKPDGTKIETVEKLIVKDEEQVEAKEENKESLTVFREIEVEAELPKYKIGLGYGTYPSPNELVDLDWKKIHLTGAARIGNLPLWLEGQVGLQWIGIGVSFEW